jgi:hypothetical protein
MPDFQQLQVGLNNVKPNTVPSSGFRPLGLAGSTQPARLVQWITP